MNTWTNKWKKVLIWFSGYFSFIAFAIVGGYTITKVDDEGLKKTAKEAFIVTLIFAALSAFFSLFNYVGGLTDSYYSSAGYEIYQICSAIVNMAKIIVFAVFIIMALVKKEEN